MSDPGPRERRPGLAGGRGGAAPTPPSAETPVYVISVAAELTGLHPQTLRTYDRLGLVSPGRAGGGGRRYSWRDIEMLREIAELSASGIGLEGVRRILELENHVSALQLRLREAEEQLAAAEYALAVRLADLGSRPNLPAVPRGGDQSLVLWTRRR
jgi:MerR family transcriptional regulator/heat shock protein HspR